MMQHTHSHESETEHQGDGRLVLAILVNILLTVAQVVGGVISGSLSLVADALHNLNDAGALGLALFARKVARRPADNVRTFGYRKAEVIGALVNTTALILVGLYLIYEAAVRFFNPQPIDGWIVIIVAGIALVVDVVTAMVTYSMAKSNLNIKAAFIHNVTDALGSVAVIVVGVLVLLFEWYFADLVATLLLAAYILVQGFRLLSESVRILMDSVPVGLDLKRIEETILSVPGVEGAHHIHVWQVDENHRALEAHIVVVPTGVEEYEAAKRALKEILQKDYSISHTTLEMEPPGECPDEGTSCAGGSESVIRKE
jgi:cobalt-zinc-cadmium efflux system protein